METVICQYCEHEWLPRVPKPLKCPRCWRADPVVEPVEVE